MVVSTLLVTGAFAVSDPPPPLPDLTIRNQSYMPDVALINQPVTISFDVHNKGNLECGYSTVEIKCDDPDYPPVYLQVNALHPDEFDYFEHVVVFPEAGSYKFEITADYYDVIAEKNENDNQKKVTVTVYDPGADLIVDSLTHDPLDPNTSDTITITAVVKNVGETSATASVLEIVVWVNAIDYPTTHAVPVLWPGDEFEVQREIPNPLPDCYTIIATADVDDDVMERFEDNNTETDDFCVRGYGPDLTVFLSNDPPEPSTLDNPTTIVAEVKNIGNVEATTSTLWLMIYGPDIFFDTFEYEIPPLGIGESYFIYHGIHDPQDGDYYVWATADNYDDVIESEEGNNDDYLEFTIREAQPDLIVESVTHAPSVPTTVDTITITAIIKNQGVVPAGPSTAAIKVGDEALPTTHPVPELAPDETFQIQRQLTLDVGVYLVEVTADYDDDVDETREKNNSGYDAIEVLPEPLPDLVVSALDHDPANPNTDDLVTITAIVENIGDVPSSSSILLLMVDGEPTSHTIPALDPDETFEVERDVNFPLPGDYDVLAVADAGDDVDEEDEDNNTAEDAITVTPAPRPDLVVDSLTHDPVAPTTWDVVTITAIVKNIGNLAATTSTLELKIDDEPVPTLFEIPALDPDETFQVQRQEMFGDPETYTVTATADINDDVDESIEDNNTATDDIIVTLPEAPDLVVSSLTHDPLNPFTIDTVTITAVVENIGNAESTTSTLVIEVVGEATPASFDVPPLEIGESVIVERPIDFASAGDYTIIATADAEDDNIELDEDNNTAMDAFEVKEPGPDLIVETLTHDPTAPTTWDEITITAIVKNVGNAAAGASSLAIRAGGETIPATYPIPALDPGETFEVEREVNFPTPLTYQITATADVDEEVEESDEENNVTIDIFSVALPDVPDLVISGLSFATPPVLVGDLVSITAEVKNVGTEAATSFTLCILVGDEVSPECFEVSGLDPGTTTTVQRDITFTEAGSYLVTATADADDIILELDEDNNVDTIEISVYEISLDRLKDYLLGKVEFTLEEMDLYDINKDGIVDIADLISMMIV